MARTVRATYSDGVLKPSEELDVEDGTEVSVSIPERQITAEDVKASMSMAGAWKGKIDAEALIAEIYEARLTGSRNADELKAE